MGWVFVLCIKECFVGKKNIVVVIGGMMFVVVVEMMIFDLKYFDVFFVFVCGGLGENV